MPRFPVLPTLIVVAACATMVALGIWQLGRLKEKEALIARYQAAEAMSADVPWPQPAAYEESLFRHATLDCRKVEGLDSVSGRSRSGASGWAHIARCTLPDGGLANIAIGWSRNPNPPQWPGGTVGGLVAPYGSEVKLIADQGQAGLEPLARPDPADLPNNHLSYAFQWFFFALTAAVIYVLALRKKQRGS